LAKHIRGLGAKSLNFRNAAAVLACLLPGAAWSHPHVWVDATSEILFSTSGQITGIRHHWQFDEAFSAFAVEGLDTDGDGAYSREELLPLAQINVESLSDYEFFTFLTAGSYQAGFAAPKDYWLELIKDRLTLHFTLPLAQPFVAKAVTLKVYDPEYFVAFSLPSTDAVRLDPAPAGCSVTVTLAKEPDADAAAALAAIAADQRELPPELKSLTEGLDNSAVVACS
jgi:ABC-type uncharacterized transport system substrate-binding protein